MRPVRADGPRCGVAPTPPTPMLLGHPDEPARSRSGLRRGPIRMRRHGRTATAARGRADRDDARPSPGTALERDKARPARGAAVLLAHGPAALRRACGGV